MCASIFAKDHGDGRWWSTPPSNVTFKQTKRYTAMRLNISGLWKQNGFSNMPQVQGISCCQVILPRARKKKKRKNLLGDKNLKNTHLFQKQHWNIAIRQFKTFKGILQFMSITSRDCQNNYLSLFKSLKLENILENNPCYKTLWQIDWCTSNKSQKSI